MELQVSFDDRRKRLPRVNDEVDPRGSGRRPDLEREHPAREHVLLTVLGVRPQTASYMLGDCHTEARLAPVALLDLLSPADRPGRVAAVCTPEATRESWPILEAALRGRCPVERIDVASGMAQPDVDSYLGHVSNAVTVSGEVDLTVDVTHGYRHFSFLTYIGVLYLAALRGVRVRGAYYGLLRSDAPSRSSICVRCWNCPAGFTRWRWCVRPAVPCRWQKRSTAARRTGQQQRGTLRATRDAVKSRSGATTASLAAEPMAGVSVPAVTARAARPSRPVADCSLVPRLPSTPGRPCRIRFVHCPSTLPPIESPLASACLCSPRGVA